MTLTIEVPPALESRLQDAAAQRGLSTGQLVALALDNLEAQREAQRDDSAARLSAWNRVGSYDNRTRAGLPPLSDDDVSRESIYEARGE